MLTEEVPVGPNRVGHTRPRQLILMDLRGTGGSGPLRCDALERNDSSSSAAAACAAELGARRGFYTARDSAEDVEAVRQALGVERIVLLGVEHGARVALAYAQRYPARVDRLVLQSPPAPEGNDLLYRSSFASIPAVVRARCSRRACRRGSKSPLADVVTLAGRLERGPIWGAVVDASGRRRSRRFGAFDLFEALGGSLASPSPTYQWGLPGQVRNARRGDAAPLLRGREMAGWYADLGVSPEASRRRFSVAAYAASICEESVLPWPRDAALGYRQASASALAHGLPPRTFHPFGPQTALASPVRLYGRPVHAGALRHGIYRLGFRRARFALREASYVPGVLISGSMAPFDESSPSRSRGSLSVSGRLGGRPVRARVGQWTYPDVSFGR